MLGENIFLYKDELQTLIFTPNVAYPLRNKW